MNLSRVQAENNVSKSSESSRLTILFVKIALQRASHHRYKAVTTMLGSASPTSFYVNLFARHWLTLKGTGFNFQAYMPRRFRGMPWSPHPKTRKIYLRIWALRKILHLQKVMHGGTPEEKRCKKILNSKVLVISRWGSYTPVLLAKVLM